jgi:hypothetical protein
LPFRVFGIRRSTDGVATARRSLIGSASRSESLLDEVAHVLLMCSRYAVSHFLGYAVFPHRTSLKNTRLSNESSLRVGLRLEHLPTNPSRANTTGAALNRLLSWASCPYSTLRLEGPPSTGVSMPATFRPQGLVTLSTVFSLRAPASFVSRRRRSWDYPFEAFPSRMVIQPFPIGWTHIPFRTCVLSGADAGPARRAAVPGLRPIRESLAIRCVVSASAAGCSLGVRPFRVFQQWPCLGFRPNSSHALYIR